jgi:hypothetical protein
MPSLTPSFPFLFFTQIIHLNVGGFAAFTESCKSLCVVNEPVRKTAKELAVNSLLVAVVNNMMIE